MPGEGVGDSVDAARPNGGLVTVLVVDDQAAFRGALRELVAATEGFALVGEAASGEQALEAVEELAPRLVIMDKRMPGLGGIAATRLLTRQHPDVVVVLVSLEDPDPDVARSCGAATFLSKGDLSIESLRQVWRDFGGGEGITGEGER
jgi:two-component system, NarL family, invasion response regulator UvrY